MYELVVDISRKLRSMGVRTSVAESIDACSALKVINLDDFVQFKSAIKVTMIKDFSKYDLLDQILEDSLRSYGRGEGRGEDGKEEEGGEGEGSELGSADRTENKFGPDKSQKNVRAFMYSPLEVLSRRQLKPIDLESLREGKRVVRRMRRRLALLHGRRVKPSRKGEVDFVRTFRRSLSTVGEIIELKKVAKVKTRARLAAFIDVSGSMDSYTDWLVKSMIILKKFARRYEIFVFSTRLIRITDIATTPSISEMMRKLYERVDIWGSGTRIGYSLKTFLENYGNLVDKTWVVIIISDGWDTGEPDLLSKCMEMLKLKVGRIVWLNPHADKPNFRPMTVGMLAALPYIDLLAGTSALEDLASYTRFFGKSIKPIKPNVPRAVPTYYFP